MMHMSPLDYLLLSSVSCRYSDVLSAGVRVKTLATVWPCCCTVVHCCWYIGDRTAWILPFTSGGFIYIALVTVLPDLLQDSSNPWYVVHHSVCMYITEVLPLYITLMYCIHCTIHYVFCTIMFVLLKLVFL